MARKANFDRNEKLDLAMHVFWEKGYAATSVADLVDTLNINRFSLYNTYGDKQALYYEALNRYLETVSMPSIEPLRSVSADLNVLVCFLTAFAEKQKVNSQGCFMQNAVVEHAGKNVFVLETGNLLFDTLCELIGEILTRARDSGKLHPYVNPQEFAQMIVVQMQGIRVMSKAKRFDDIKATLNSLCALLGIDNKANTEQMT